MPGALKDPQPETEMCAGNRPKKSFKTGEGLRDWPLR